MEALMKWRTLQNKYLHLGEPTLLRWSLCFSIFKHSTSIRRSCDITESMLRCHRSS